jgi:hypothetical protein
MFKLEGGLMLMPYPRSELAKDANIALGPAQAASSASAMRFPAGRTSMLCSRAPSTPAGRSPTGRTIVHEHLLRLLPRPRRAPVGGHLEPQARAHGGVRSATPEGRAAIRGTAQSRCVR